MSQNTRPKRKAATAAEQVIEQDLARRQKLTEAERAAEDEEDSEVTFSESESDSLSQSDDETDDFDDDDED